jgi:hypothetical protein
MMKYLHILLWLFPLLTSGQDSLSVNHFTEEVEEFKPTRLIDEFEQNFGNKEVSLRLKVGIRSYKNTYFSTVKTWDASIEKRLFGKTSGIISFHEKPRMIDFLGKASVLEIGLRHYLGNKDGRALGLSGTYLQLTKTFFLTEPKSPYQDTPFAFYNFYSQNYYSGEKRVASIKFGQQFGNFLDLGIEAGISKGNKMFPDERGVLSETRTRLILPYISTYSVISIGQELGKKREINKSCDFVNCNTKINHLFKVDLSGMVFINPYEQNARTEFSYEQKLGSWPLSFNAGMELGINRYQHYMTDGVVEVSRPDGTLHTTFKSTDKRVTTASVNAKIFAEARYYPFQKRQVALGKLQEGVQGLYIGGYYRKLLVNRSFGDAAVSLRFGEKNQLGPMLGYQRKISKRYFVDLNLAFMDDSSYQYQIGKLIINPKFRFGIAL